ncbi:uncharacterized protein BO72DRAFT_46022 [Aspergillus fijiensis CBS 313.89]|uniref:Uncharacterized protein n=1 Tax=Aspergillus fijiensis CBS 313.89 TaxID=1448319 RepID=A0A8G1W1J7_9EURO|nr:uncharacterized protein BO72DRAFT_46022 [Aspergillus fijiensis CBS 313.89]RAK79486.1 hypothetical protein BO72DRAFT_46022 [Aspergillus fijiensis CBS 313.89]
MMAARGAHALTNRQGLFSERLDRPAGDSTVCLSCLSYFYEELLGLNFVLPFLQTHFPGWLVWLCLIHALNPLHSPAFRGCYLFTAHLVLCFISLSKLISLLFFTDRGLHCSRLWLFFPTTNCCCPSSSPLVGWPDLGIDSLLLTISGSVPFPVS